MTSETRQRESRSHRSRCLRAAAALAALGVAAAACSSGGSGNDASDDAPETDPPVIESVTVNENPNSTLSAVLDVATDVPAEAQVVVTGPEREFTITSPDEPGTEVTIPVVGMRPETTYELSVTATAEGGSEPSEAVAESFTTGPLPADFPKTSVLVSDPARMEPGFTLFDANGTPPEGKTTGGTGYIIAVDTEGIPVWYYAYEGGASDARQLDDGNILMLVGLDQVRVLDVLGNVVENYAGRAAVEDAESGEKAPLPPGTVNLETDSAHHEVYPLPNGNLAVLSTTLLQVPSEGGVCGDDTENDDGTYTVVDDVVVEFERPSGNIVREVRLSDLIDPAADVEKWVCPVNTGGLADAIYEIPNLREWQHANAVVLDEDRNALIVSNRETDLILAVRYEDDENGPANELLWSFGPDGDVELEEGDFMYHQHAPQIQENGDIVFFDNGNDRPGHVDDPYSRAVRYEIHDSDPDNVVARQVWEYIPMVNDEFAYSFFVGDADVLPNGNVLISSGGYASRPIYEVVPADGPEGGEIVWLATTIDTDGVYRADRIATLTPWSETG